MALGTGMKMEDSLWAGLTDSHAGLPMGMTAENLAEQVFVCVFLMLFLVYYEIRHHLNGRHKSKEGVA